MYLVGLMLFFAVGGAWAELNCCFPKRFSGKMLQAGGTFHISSQTSTNAEAIIKINYDYASAMVSMAYGDGQHVTYYRLLNDFNAGRTYIVVGESCYIKPLDPSLLTDPCPTEPDFLVSDTNTSPIPNMTVNRFRVGSHVVNAWIHCADVRIHCADIMIEWNFTLDGEYTIGSVNNPVRVASISGPYGSTHSLYITLTTDNCTPVTQVLVGEDETEGTAGVYAFMYADVKFGVVDESALQVPDSCLTNGIHVGKRSVDGIFGRRSPF